MFLLINVCKLQVALSCVAVGLLASQYGVVWAKCIIELLHSLACRLFRFLGSRCVLGLYGYILVVGLIYLVNYGYNQ